MRALLMVAVLMMPGLAAAQPAPRPPAPPARRLDLEALVTGSVLRIGPSGLHHDTVVLGGLGVAASYVTDAHVALLAGVQLAHAGASCLQDGPCYDAAYDRLLVIGGGVRWFYRPDAYVQVEGLLARSRKRYDETFEVRYQGAGAALATGWRWALGPRSFVGIDLRVFGWRTARTDHDRQLDALAAGAGLTLGGAP